MNSNTLETLEYYRIKEQLKQYVVSGLGRRLVEELMPAVDFGTVEGRLVETTEARAIMDAAGHVPLHGLSDLSEPLEKVARGGVLSAAELERISDFLRGCRKAKRFMARYADIAPRVSGYAAALCGFEEMEEEIERCIQNGRVATSATPRLSRIRSQMELVKSRIKEKMNSFVTSAQYRDCLQETMVHLKDDRYCLAVKSASRHQLAGMVVASSGSGSTVFIEPAAVRTLVNELKVLEGEEEAEEYQILSALTGEIAAHYQAVQINLETMAAYDFAFAKAKYSRATSSIPARLDPKPRIVLRAAKHPLIGPTAVPLDFFIGDGYRTLLITGPNTGGKTVALKTIGLLALMTQSGLHIPAQRETTMGVFGRVLVDIGDRQSIEQSLSTFSGHMKNVIGILENAGKGALVLLDEIGTGTDPAEGAALAAAVLDDLYLGGSITVATTHYGDLKRFAVKHEGFRNGCMDFDPETLKPLYHLRIGKSGRSNGFWIAERLGMKPATLQKAREFSGNPSDDESDETEEVLPLPIPPAAANPVQPERLEPKGPKEAPIPRPLQVGDSVYVSTLKEHGILCDLADGRGEMTVLVRGKKIRVNRKRLSLHIPKEELYPEDYDLKIVLLSKEERRLDHQMSRKHVAGVVRVVKEGEGDMHLQSLEKKR